ncbi:MAG: protease inhibitor I42 family protein [Syntrophomonadaceae bacterium]
MVIMKRLLPVLLAAIILLFPAAALGEPIHAGFSDTANHPASRDIELVANLGIMVGTGTDVNGTAVFEPSAVVSKAQLAVVLQRTFQLDYDLIRFIKQPVASDYYRDVPNESWYAEAAVMCAINNIFPSGGNFEPDEAVSRLDVAQALHRSFQAKHISIPMIMLMPAFEDTDALTQEEMNAVVFVNNTGIMPGESGFFSPGMGVQRSKLAQVLGRCVYLMALGENDSGQEYQVPSGNTFIIALPSNPTTGYSWTLQNPGDGNIVTPLTDFYLAESSGEAMIVGQGGKHYWQFKALQPGSTKLELVYARTWESVAPLSVFTLPITVR